MNSVKDNAAETAEEKKEKTLTTSDRCDSGDCGAAALVKVAGVTGDLMFCGHHYTEIEQNPESNKKLTAFAFKITDERWTLLGENRLKEDS